MPSKDVLTFVFYLGFVKCAFGFQVAVVRAAHG